MREQPDCVTHQEHDCRCSWVLYLGWKSWDVVKRKFYRVALEMEKLQCKFCGFELVHSSYVLYICNSLPKFNPFLYFHTPSQEKFHCTFFRSTALSIPHPYCIYRTSLLISTLFISTLFISTLFPCFEVVPSCNCTLYAS